MVAAPSSGVDANVYIDDAQHRFTGPPLDTGKPVLQVSATQTAPSSIAAATTTGAYRRVFSTPGSNQLAATVYLPCSAARLIGDDDNYDIETGFVYTGGWGNGNNGAAIDAGFQASSWHDGTDRDAYSLFILFHGKMTTKQKSTDPDLPRFLCDRYVDLQFGPESDTTIGVTATGYVSNTTRLTEHLTVPSRSGDGWGLAPGSSSNGAILKRMTTIGQPDRPGSAHAYSRFQSQLQALGGTWDFDGSFFGIRANDPTPLVRWTNVRLGVSHGGVVQYHRWQASDTKGCHNVPSRDRVAVHYVDAANEDNGINLASKPSPARPGIFSCK